MLFCGTREPVAPMPREKLKREAPTRARVPMRGTGTEQSVVGMKVLQWNWTEGTAVSCRGRRPTGDGRSRVTKAKPFDIPKREVWEAFKKVKANRGAAGVDGQSIAEFETALASNLYRLWNRLSSGSYFPPPVRRVDIPKASGGTRPLGIPTWPIVSRRRLSAGFWSRVWNPYSTRTHMATGPAARRSTPCTRHVSAAGD